jgi:recombinational DNA repair protein (RecF pathway)
MQWYLLTLNNNERVAYKKIFSESFPNEIIPQRWLKGILECSEIFDKLYLLIQNEDAIYKINSIKAFLRENSEELKKNPELFEQYLKLIQII